MSLSENFSFTLNMKKVHKN